MFRYRSKALLSEHTCLFLFVLDSKIDMNDNNKKQQFDGLYKGHDLRRERSSPSQSDLSHLFTLVVLAVGPKP